MEAKGEDAPAKPTGFTELERTYIAIGIACGILAIIVSIAVIAVRNNFIHHPVPTPCLLLFPPSLNILLFILLLCFLRLLILLFLLLLLRNPPPPSSSFLLLPPPSSSLLFPPLPSPSPLTPPLSSPCLPSLRLFTASFLSSSPPS